MVALAFVAGVIATIGLTDSAFAQKRVALVIGNGAYTKVPRLDNPKNDAAAMEAMFKAAGFNAVVRANDLGVVAMRRALRDFSDTAHDADIAVVFYAGHGIEVGGVNYLIPVDAILERDIDARDEAISLDRVNEVVEPVKHLRLVILDACRDNPFARSMRRTIATRSVRSGYGEIDERSLPPNTLVAYAQRAGSTAEDGVGSNNSPYTTALIKHLPTPGLDIELALRRVRDEVLRATKNRQEPFKYGSLGGSEIVLMAAKTAETAKQVETGATKQLSEAAEAWDRVKDTTSPTVLESYSTRYKDTIYADLARARIDELKRQQLAMADAAKQETDRKRAEAETARKKAEGDERVKAAADAERQRLAMLRQEDERKRAEAEGAKKQESVASGTERPGTVFHDCSECPEMVVVPAGEFMMGSPQDEEGRAADEGPRRKVTIAKPFAVGRFEATFAEWDACVAGGGCAANKNPDDGGWGRGKRPVINVSWDDASQYVTWLSNKTGKSYRLLTEAEWEYAARGITSTSVVHTPFSTGATISTVQANYNGKDTYGNGKKGLLRGKTVEVGSFPGNAFGLHDMHGNVWEWVGDCHKDSYSGAPSDGSAVTSGTCDYRVLRGGSWADDPRILRSAFRNRNVGIIRSNNNIGFRVSRTL
jgi:formylglycine-generating enzyme required for sulfatase activity